MVDIYQRECETNRFLRDPYVNNSKISQEKNSNLKPDKLYSGDPTSTLTNRIWVELEADNPPNI